MEKLYHNISAASVIKILNSDVENGLSNKEIHKRKLGFGKNVLNEEKKYSNIRLFLSQFKSPLMYILVFAGIVTLFVHNYTDSVVILLAAIVNALFGYFEENKVSNVLRKLKNTLKIKTTVLREGVKKEIFEEDLVPGDIIFLKAGQKIPADGRLISANNLKTSESVLTGEWLSEEKNPNILPRETILADRKNMIYMGGLIENGTGKAIVTAISKKTEAGKIASLINDAKEIETPLQEKLHNFSKIISIVIGIGCFIIFLLGIFLRDLSWAEMFETSIAIAVGGIPEALPIVITMILVIGGERILRKQGLIRKLTSVETLGSTQIICFDKTKTLTEGKMKLNNIITQDGELAMEASIFCSDAYMDEEGIIVGGGTGAAILEGALNNKFDIKKTLEIEEIQNLPFNSINKYALSLRKEGNKKTLYICGAPEKILEKSKNASLWHEEIERLAEKGLRVIAVGCKEIKKTSKDLNKIAKNFNFIGLISFIDPIRNDVRESIEICKEAGIKTILATGDHAKTAKTIAEEIGLQVEAENILEGKDLDNLTDSELEEKMGKIKIFARVEPRHKLRIVAMWQKKGKVIAMTGDGINDAPAIKKADIGIALGSGTEVAKEASDLVLLDDSFTTIVKTIEEGRTVLDNLRKSLSYALADSFTSIILVTFSTILFGWPLPILPMQILWNNLIEDTFPTIAFAFEPKEKNVMRRKPNNRKTGLLTKEMKTLIFATGIIDQFVILLFFSFLYFKQGMDLDHVRTIMFGIICIDTAFVIFAYKNLRKNLWQINPFSNKYLNLSSILVIILFCLAIYNPFFQTILKTMPLDLTAWGFIILAAVLSITGIELTKYFFIARGNTES
ncbi:MAG: HAD-IC family P-type ATPase [Candidatus Pacebacteria bacterium]|nr:HAD-IC family P-type ATPase [Candidatus Paceibacterota bacterium]